MRPTLPANAKQLRVHQQKRIDEGTLAGELLDCSF